MIQKIEARLKRLERFLASYKAYYEWAEKSGHEKHEYIIKMYMSTYYGAVELSKIVDEAKQVPTALHVGQTVVLRKGNIKVQLVKFLSDSKAVVKLPTGKKKTINKEEIAGVIKKLGTDGKIQEGS